MSASFSVVCASHRYVVFLSSIQPSSLRSHASIPAPCPLEALLASVAARMRMGVFIPSLYALERRHKCAACHSRGTIANCGDDP